MTDHLSRPDFAVIAGWVEPGHRILDLGCGDGSLLKLLIATKGVRGWGIEIDDANVLAAMRQGINIIQGNLENGLAGFADRAFDLVVLSRTLQTVRHTEVVLAEMLRVGREAVVSFPNFAYWKNRQAVLNGRMPVSEDLPYEWYDSPNLRFFAIPDFEALAAKMGLDIRERRVLDEKGRLVTEEPNFLGSLAVYRLSRSR
ncbi:MAG TPA: methionine biosynthesis protein MetW [Rhodocyclaceae bacterium]|jgi:methionine biosynthesis protein MetW|nr:methionine biosynthesis protein MetW [Rhodocyclaceae bacterium]HMV19636.1 methionine biosynthesis protein MetW [Rhodocyclaceae bacterium]HMW76397.1 methionine biosynthesis protein MetW [Rhodocyclaceae bacterium]HNE41945.1 methionine biosynthesis protein MetW [Rhodocyclaceae bacterium]HNL20949.1 methionine biosynthesis protein MetW [Rhodocyclaceae bacterium]